MRTRAHENLKSLLFPPCYSVALSMYLFLKHSFIHSLIIMPALEIRGHRAHF